jgi:hypothetical protein
MPSRVQISPVSTDEMAKLEGWRRVGGAQILKKIVHTSHNHADQDPRWVWSG